MWEVRYLEARNVMVGEVWVRLVLRLTIWPSGVMVYRALNREVMWERSNVFMCCPLCV